MAEAGFKPGSLALDSTGNRCSVQLLLQPGAVFAIGPREQEGPAERWRVIALSSPLVQHKELSGQREGPTSVDGMLGADERAGCLPHSLSSHSKKDSPISGS